MANTKYISSWKSKGLSDESIKPYATSNNSLTPYINRYKDIEEYGYSGYGIGFDRRGSFSFPGGGFLSKCNNFWSRYEFFYSY